MTELPMFPLGTVLFPFMPLPLRVFEERYLVMLSRILQQEPSEFGVALIERGQESGGGGSTFDVGTVAQITELEAAPDFIAMMTQGERRFEIVQWLDDEPHPRADVRYLAELEWTDDLQPLFERAEKVVRRALARASEFGASPWAATVELDDAPVAASWQLAAIAPLEQLDQVALLRSTSLRQLLDSTIELTLAAEELLGS
jgi:Lon protease-like protein